MVVLLIPAFHPWILPWEKPSLDVFSSPRTGCSVFSWLLMLLLVLLVVGTAVVSSLVYCLLVGHCFWLLLVVCCLLLVDGVGWWLGVVLFWLSLPSLVRQFAVTSLSGAALQNKMDQIARAVAFQSGPRSVGAVQKQVGLIHFVCWERKPYQHPARCSEDADSLLVLLDYIQICINAMHFIVRDVSSHTTLNTCSIVKKSPNISIASFPLFLSSLVEAPQWTQAALLPGDHSWGNGTTEPLRAGLARRTETIVEAQLEKHPMRQFTFCHLEFLDFSRRSSVSVTAETMNAPTLASFAVIAEQFAWNCHWLRHDCWWFGARIPGSKSSPHQQRLTLLIWRGRFHTMEFWWRIKAKHSLTIRSQESFNCQYIYIYRSTSWQTGSKSSPRLVGILLVFWDFGGCCGASLPSTWGFLGNCWLVASIAAIVKQPTWIRKLFVEADLVAGWAPDALPDESLWWFKLQLNAIIILVMCKASSYEILNGQMDLQTWHSWMYYV